MLKKGTIVQLNGTPVHSTKNLRPGVYPGAVGEIVNVSSGSALLVSWCIDMQYAASTVHESDISVVHNSLWQISDITVGRIKGTVEAPTRRAALIRGNKKFGWDRFHRAQFVHTL